jgi:hypothetical protein
LIKSERNRTFAVGRLGEKIAKEYFNKKGIETLSATLDEQKNEHWDFKILLKDGAHIKFEIKTDVRSEDTGNLFLETEVNDKKGFLKKYDENSDIVFGFVFPKAKRIGFIQAKELVKIPLENYTYKKITHRSNNYTSAGYLVPVADINFFSVKDYT